VNGQQVAEGRVANTNPIMFSADEAADVGVDEGTPVTEAYTAAGSRFTGRIRKLTVDVR
jgi:arylsulfatase